MPGSVDIGRPVPPQFTHNALQRDGSMNLLQVLGVLLLGLAWMVPGHYFPWLTFQQEFTASLGAALLAWSVALKRGATIRWPWLAGIGVAASAMPLLQYAFGQIRFISDATLAAAYLMAFGLAVALGATLVRKPQRQTITWMLAVLAGAAMLSTAMMLAQWLEMGVGGWIDGVRPGGRPYANFGQANNTATAVAIGVCIVLLAYERRHVGAITTTLILAFLGWGLVMTQSRTGWLFVLLLAIGLLCVRRRAALRVPAIAVATGAALFFLAVALWAPLNDLLLISVGERLENRLTSGGARWIHWQVMWDAAWRAPWFGYGWTQAALAQQAAVIDHPATGHQLLSSHNLVLDLLVWNGIPIGTVLVAALVGWFWRQARSARSSDRVCLLAAVAAVFLHALLEFPLEYAFFLLPVGVLMGALEGLDPPARALELPRSTLVIPCLLLSGLLIWVGIEYPKVEETGRTMRFVAMGIGVDRVATAPEPDVLLLDRPRHLHRFMLTPARQSSDPDYLPWVHDVAMRHPSAPGMLRHALAAGLNGHPDEAAVVLRRLCKMYDAKRCDQGRESWTLLQQRHEVLRSIAYPDTPVEMLPH